MAVPEKYWRYPTRAAIDALSRRFGLRNEPDMQDWEYEVADASRLEEFLRALEAHDLTDDERFTLSETVMECFEDLAQEGADLVPSGQWDRFVQLLRARVSLHARTLCYWSDLESPLEDAWRVSPLVRPLWAELEPSLRNSR
jgi:hypothetical protein